MLNKNLPEDITILNFYSEQGESINNLVQEWLNEKNFFWNFKNNQNDI